MIGVALGLSAGALFAAGTVLARVGQRGRPDDDGLLMTVLVNVLVLGALALTVEAPTWNTSAIVALVIGGILGSLLGRLSMLRAVRLVGPTRSSAFMTGSPLVAAFAGWLILGEEVGAADGMGGLLVIFGLLALIRSRSTPTALVGGTPVPATKRLVRIGYAFATAAPLFFGLGFVLKKWGLISYPEPVLGAFIGTVAAFLLVVLIELGSGRLGQRLDDNFRNIPWWFVAAGVAMSGALLSQFAAFTHLPAWLVGVLQGTQGLWALLFGWKFLRSEERIDRWVVASILLVLAGVILIGIQM